MGGVEGGGHYCGKQVVVQFVCKEKGVVRVKMVNGKYFETSKERCSMCKVRGVSDNTNYFLLCNCEEINVFLVCAAPNGDTIC